MLRYLVFLLASLTAPANADTLFYQGRNFSVQLLSSPCTNSALNAELLNFNSAAPSAAVILSGGQRYVGCWTALDAEDYLLLDEAGNGGTIPKKEFSKPSI